MGYSRHNGNIYDTWNDFLHDKWMKSTLELSCSSNICGKLIELQYIRSKLEQMLHFDLLLLKSLPGEMHEKNHTSWVYITWEHFLDKMSIKRLLFRGMTLYFSHIFKYWLNVNYWTIPMWKEHGFWSDDC